MDNLIPPLFLLSLLGLPFKSKSCLAAEDAALRRQVIALQSKIRGRREFTDSERLFFIQLGRWFPSVLNAIKIIRPETLVRWHRAVFLPVLALEVSQSRRPAADRCG